MYASKEVSEIISRKIEERAISITELARLSGCTRMAIYYWTHGKRTISIDAADRILSVLGIQYILGGKNDRK